VCAEVGGKAYWHGATLHPACCLQNKCVWKQTEISFVRSGKRNMAENPFARCERSESDSYYLASWIFRQILLVAEHKTDFRVIAKEEFETHAALW